jgi:hypothetical protein
MGCTCPRMQGLVEGLAGHLGPQAVAIGTPGAALAATKYGVAAFVESADSGEVLQAADLVSCQ